ncbi:hypothetical protein BDZ89DRAFT_1128414 [Hymenopellis radicata]|nr:hypothetical protein BDZ89DRAFT_1128414 [Hymenopellis radicata]
MPLSPLASDDTSILSRRRPSTTADLPAKIKYPGDVRRPSSSYTNEVVEVDDPGGFHKNLLLDMKQMVGGAVGNMSISPYSRDIVLAARRGLFIIDLEANLEVPRFLPQGGTWDVADVQWNPHTSRAEYIVSTSCEKLLIWNLMASGNSNIEHILSAHYRAITDINWHTKEPTLSRAREAIFGLCAFAAPGTQVKWNRQDPNILASAHANQVLIWDRRKGSLPISKIDAHTSKIYGIDWSHHDSREIVTCSLDKTIKVWDMHEADPKAVINTTYPVWRARNLPFGRGILSLAQRGETMLEMYATEGSREPIHEFEGHTDVVKEFVWRRGGQDGNDFQLITWSKDRTLRFWGVDSDIIQQVGSTPVKPRNFDPDRTISFRTPPHTPKHPILLSAPVGHRSILAEVRAGAPPRQQQPPLPQPIVSKAKMTRGSMRSSARGGVDGLTCEGNSAEASRMSSRSRGNEDERRSESRSRGVVSAGIDDPKESLQDEITRVITTLAQNKVRLERHELTAKKRFCTIGLHGPWGQSSTVFVFMRITFTFPKEYPHRGPDSTPVVSLEPNPLISINDRARILRKLKTIRESRRPCLEPCLRFLLFKNEDVDEKPIHLDSESSDEDDDGKRREQEHTVALLKDNKNLAEPRTTQGVFGPNGELVCFFNSPPRSMKNIPRFIESPTTQSPTPEEKAENMYQSPALATEAIRRLEAAAVDHQSATVRFRDRFRATPQHYVTPQKTTVLLINTTTVAGGDRKVARGYVFTVVGNEDEVWVFCVRETLRSRVSMADTTMRGFSSADGVPSKNDALWNLVKQIMNALAEQKDVQMLAMVAMTVLQVIPPLEGLKPLSLKSPRGTPFRTGFSDGYQADYFSMARSAQRIRSGRESPKSPMWPRLSGPSSPTNLPSASASSSSSRAGSWSSLFTTNTMRQFMAEKLTGVQDSFKDGLMTPSVEKTPPLMMRSTAIPIPARGSRAEPLSPHPHPHKKSAGGNESVISRSWNDEKRGDKRRTSTVSFSPAKSIVSNVTATSNRGSGPRKRVVFEEAPREASLPLPFNRNDVLAYVRYVHAYAEFLFRWELHHKRLELLKVVDPHAAADVVAHQIGVSRICAACQSILSPDARACPACHHPSTMPDCAICRLPVKAGPEAEDLKGAWHMPSNQAIQSKFNDQHHTPPSSLSLAAQVIQDCVQAQLARDISGIAIERASSSAA